jgi:hypothetical protein
MNLPHSVLRTAMRPLTLAQIFSSAAGAGGMVIAAWAMVPTEFTQFALFTLLGSLALGLGTSGLFQPALIHQRIESNSFVPMRYVAIPAATASVLYSTFALIVGIRNPADLLLLGGSAALPVYYQWLRYRAMGCNRRWIIAQADLLRLVLTASVVAIPVLIADSVALQTYFAAATSLPMLLIGIKLPRISKWIPYKRYGRAAGWQLLDWAFGSMLLSLPLLFLGGVSRSPLVGGVRLAQSLLGPINLAFAAATTNLVADGVSKPELADSQSVMARGSLLGRQLMALSLIIVAAVISVVYVSRISLRGVATSDLIIGLALVGSSLITAGWTGIRGIVLRLLCWQARVTVARGGAVILTLGAFAAAYYWWGADASLILGFITQAVASPVILIGLTYNVHRSSNPVEVSSRKTLTREHR